MKKHAIIPIFIPHQGCPNDCVFCNQKIITARQPAVTEKEVTETIETWLSTLTGRGLETIEIAFFGGSFTGIPMEQQSRYLSIARKYKDQGLVDRIHLSTRPDYINHDILENLKEHSVDVIELGVQSFDDRVLQLSNRGHDSAVVYEAASLIQDYRFTLGIQLMIGLPGDSLESCLFSAQETVKIKPQLARLYPTIVIEDTELMKQYRQGIYTPLPLEKAVNITKEMYLILQQSGIKIIRVGLKSSDLIQKNGQIIGNTFHPAFRQLVEGQIAREMLEKQLITLLEEDPQNDTVTFVSNAHNFSNMIGNKKVNRIYFQEKYPQLKISWKTAASLADDQYNVIK